MCNKDISVDSLRLSRDTAEEPLEMDASNVSVLSSSFAWPSRTSDALSSIHNNQSSKVDERRSPQAVVLNGISLPVVQIAQQEGQQAPFQLATGGTSFAIENANLSVIFTPQPQTVLQNPPSQTITLNIMNNLPILNPNSPASLIGASPGKSKSIGKHICAHCGRDCLKPSVLEKHIRSHTGERPFPCNICGISFKTQSNLYKHRRTQTHVNNAKQSFDSDCGSYNDDKLHVVHNTCLDLSSGTRDACMDNSHFIQNKNLCGVLEDDCLEGSKGDACILSSAKIHDKSHGDSDYLSQTIFSPGMPNLQRTVIDPKSTSSSRHGQLQRQHETCVDKQWDSYPSERKLKKCESTDSGYLSHSDSADLQMFSGSPLHSLSECSIESENMLGIGSGYGEDKAASSNKKNLEERISMLISQNKAVVDNTHLDNVRPRKTALSKQGSIDLPMPYTFKDSFHFDIKSLDANRKKVSSCSAKSTFTPSEKNKPLFFHSVPTQISTTIENIILTRSNSLPFVESGRLKDRLNVHNILSHGSGKQPLNASYGNLLLSNTATACTVDFSSSHPRGLVRQAAVDEMQICNGSDPTICEEIKEKNKATGDQLSSKSKIANKKGGQRKLNMFSHEKWQIYGDETFKKFYQKIKKSELVKKTKQDTPESKGIISNEISLQPACELGKPSKKLSSIPVVAPPTSSLQFTCSSANTSASKEIDTPLSIGNGHITLDIESNVQGKVSEAKFSSGINMSKGDIKVKQTVQKNVPTPSTGVCDNSNIVVMENQLKGHDHLEADNFKIHERSPSDRKKIKVAGLKGEILYSVSLDIPEDTIDLKNKNIDGITDSENTMRTLSDSGASTVVSCHSLSTIINKNIFLSQEDSGQIPAHSKKGQHVILTTESSDSSTLKGMLFSPRYLIKFNYAETSVDKSVLQSNQPTVCGSFSSDLINVTEDTNSNSLHAPTKGCHQTFIENQPKLTQDSVIAPFGKINLIEECVPICCSSKISQNLVQNKSLDTQGSQYQKVRLNDTYLERHNTFEDHKAVKDLISKHIDLKSSMSLISTDTMSTSEVKKLPHDPLLLDIIQPGGNIWKPLNITGFLNQEDSSFSTTCTSSSSGIYSIKVTQVTFSTMNTEPKSTWCWLNRCLPLPAEQKEKSCSVYASLSSDDFKERKLEPHGNRIEKDMSHMTTIDGQPMMSLKQKNCFKEETDKGIYHPLVKKSSKMGTIMKSRHVKRSKDGTRGHSHSKMSQHKTTGALGQDQQHTQISCPSNLETGEISLRTANFELSNKEGSKARIHHPTFHPGGDLSQKSEDKATSDSQMNEGSITTTVQEDNQSLQPMEKTTDLRPPRLASLSWQKSCLNALPTDNEVELHQHLSICPPRNNVRKILHRSKTIGHSLGDDAVGSTSRMISSESQPRLPVEAKDGIGKSSLQNTSSLGFHMVPNTHSSGSSLEPGTLSLNHGEPSGPLCQSHKTQKKINLELMRKQTHVEYSDSSSDDEDRLYIEILE